MICLLSVLLNVPAPPATSFHAPIPRSGLVHWAQISFQKVGDVCFLNIAMFRQTR